MSAADLTGHRFGKWTVLRPAATRRGASFSLCRCDCGTEGEIRNGNLRSGQSKQCRLCHQKRRRRAFCGTGHYYPGDWRSTLPPETQRAAIAEHDARLAAEIARRCA